MIPALTAFDDATGVMAALIVLAIIVGIFWVLAKAVVALVHVTAKLVRRTFRRSL